MEVGTWGVEVEVGTWGFEVEVETWFEVVKGTEIWVDTDTGT